MAHCDDLPSRILRRLGRQAGGAPGWLRFLAKSEARQLGLTEPEAEAALDEMLQDGYLRLAFGFERGSLTPRGRQRAAQLSRATGAMSAA